MRAFGNDKGYSRFYTLMRVPHLYPLISTVHHIKEMLTVNCKFTKKKLLIPGFDEWTAEDWANAFLVALVSHDWGNPVTIISDRDSKFMSTFWRTNFRKLGVTLATSTAYHPQTDGQSERTNQTVEIALRSHLTTGTDDWVKLNSVPQLILPVDANETPTIR